MGLFSKVKDAVSDVFKGVVDVIDKVTGGGFSKLLGNKWVKGALMAVSIVTGGIAIANGIMAAGQVGIGEAVKAFATNMTSENAGSLFSKVVEGGKAFLSGVQQGLTNPMGSDAGQALEGMFDSAVSNITGEPLASSDILAVGDTSAADTMLESAGADVSGMGGLDPSASATTVDPMAGLDPMAGQTLDPGMPQALQGQSYDPAMMPGGQSPSPLNMPDAMGGPPSMSDMAGGPVGAYQESLGAANDALTGAGMDPLQSTIGQATQQSAAAPSTWMDKVKGAATSPQGMMTMAQMAQGWAQGKMMEARWDEMKKEEKRRAKSWTDGSFNMPRFGGNG